MLTQARLKELLSYDPVTGLFVRLVRRGKGLAGKQAGTRRHDGYYTIFIDGHRYLMHRLAWLYMTGEWPIHHIDHIDGNKSNNSFVNLRDVDQRTNIQNQKKANSANTNGYLGVCVNREKFAARIVVDGKQIHLGVFQTAKEAHEAYLKAKRELHKGCTI